MSTKTETLFSNINMLTYLAGMSNYWVNDMDLPKIFVNIHTPFVKFISIMTFLNILMQLGSFFTQPNLTGKQNGDRFVLAWSLLLLYFYLIIIDKNKKKIRYLMRTLGEDLKMIHNDEEVEREMVRKVKIYGTSIVVICSMTLIWFGIDSTAQHFKTGSTFAPVITAWPDVDDQRTSASIARIISYFLWWATMPRVYAAFIIVILLAISLGMQYRNLCSYFHSLNSIFQDSELTQTEKEIKFEEAFRTGIKMHAVTLRQGEIKMDIRLDMILVLSMFVWRPTWLETLLMSLSIALSSFSDFAIRTMSLANRRCVALLQEACGTVFTGQMLLNTSMLAVVLFQMVDTEHTAANVLITIWTAAGFLVCTAVFMWSAGDITAEAVNLDLAMYSSGWENCYGKPGLRVRKLAILSMIQAQKRIAVRSLGIIEISYQSYVTIVKSSYSVFSVFY